MDTEEEIRADEAALEIERKPPDLQELVAEWGGYANIPPESWTAYDAAMAAWLARMRGGEFSDIEFRIKRRRSALGGKAR